MTPPKHTPNSFRKAERLCSRQALDELYKDGESLLTYPIRCVYRTTELVDEPLRIMVSVPKRNHKTAVARNLLKRRIREAYRLNRSILLSQLPDGISLEFSFTYIAKESLNYQIIENAVKKTLAELSHRITPAAD